MCRIVGSVCDDSDVVIIIGVRVLPNWPGLVVCACVEMVWVENLARSEKHID